LFQIYFIFFIFLGRANFSKKVVWVSFWIAKNLTAGNLKILFKNRRQKNQKLPKIDTGDLKSASENPKFVIFNFFKNLLGGILLPSRKLEVEI